MNEDIVERLKRHIRALAAVNRQLRAQLSRSGADGAGSRRGSVANTWLDQLELGSGAREPEMIRTSDGATFVVEGTVKRSVRSGIIAAALAEKIGQPREVTKSAVEALEDGAPVEVMEGPKGAPFVVVGGRRLTVRGLPLPYPIGFEETQRYPQGDEINVAAAVVPRVRFQQAIRGRYQLQRVRSALVSRVRR